MFGLPTLSAGGVHASGLAFEFGDLLRLGVHEARMVS
jgi:hypothetical protein